MKKIYLGVTTIVAVAIIAGGVIFYNKYQEKKERDAFEVLLNKYPQSQQVREAINKAEKELNDSDKENDFLAYAVIGSQRNIVGDYSGAEKYYLKALSIRPTDNLVLWNLANVYIAQKKYQDAQVTLNKLIELDPYTIRYYIALADMYQYQIIDETKMVEAISRGLSNNVDHNDLLAYFAVYYKDKGDKIKAIEYYEKLVKAHPENEAAKSDLEQLKAQL